MADKICGTCGQTMPRNSPPDRDPTQTPRNQTEAVSLLDDELCDTPCDHASCDAMRHVRAYLTASASAGTPPSSPQGQPVTADDIAWLERFCKDAALMSRLGRPSSEHAAYSAECASRILATLRGAGPDSEGMATNEAFGALGRLYNYNVDPDGARAERDRVAVFNALRGNAYNARLANLMEYLDDCGSPGDILIAVEDSTDELMVILREKRHGDDGVEVESVSDAIARNLLAHGTDRAIQEFRVITVPPAALSSTPTEEQNDG